MELNGFDGITDFDVADASVKSVIVRFSRLFVAARGQAACAGLVDGDAQDCAINFAVRVLRKRGCAPEPDAWLRRCALNYAKNFRRALARRQSHERCWPEAVGCDGSHPIRDCPDIAPMLEAGLLRGEFWQRVEAAIARLEPAARELFIRHHLQGESIQSLATSTGRAAPAIKQALLRARRRLRAALERDGFDKAAACDYLALLRPPPQTTYLQPHINHRNEDDAAW